MFPQKLEPAVALKKTLARNVHIVMRPFVNYEVEQRRGDGPNRGVWDHVAVEEPD